MNVKKEHLGKVYFNPQEDEDFEDDDVEATLDMMFPNRHDPDFNDDDDGVGAFMG